MIAAPGFLGLSLVGAIFLFIVVSWARSMLRDGVALPDGRWLPPTKPGLRLKILIGASAPCLFGAGFVVIGLIGAFAPQILTRALEALVNHS